ncbi:GTPase Era [Serpentinicella alkaliphila]|uniref:GTPase Era n=1 Tax=Serpentinicella alkaliphila TaxID=1734049 RepID=A0A4R2TVV3_9FIRM|nr:GTPase Era [Serpentinicella alkaliphila]QUH26897.1 GTPase Era [Serpentinicella alkaliphila]TCQ08130.1 GTP-binding protein Era [Serpentinicella alkaliphila]
MTFKSGFVSIIGRPNVGKSTLMNKLIGEKIAIMSDKPQTTRNRIQSIYTSEDCQIIFIDTPGMHKPKHKLGEYMINTAKETLREVDVVLFVVDESKDIGPGDQFIMEQLREIKTPIILVMNKIDLMNPEQFKNLYEQFKDQNIFADIIGISALENANLNALVEKIKDFLEEGPQYFPGDMITDQPERVIVAEIIREKVLHYTDQEVPHGVAVEIMHMKPRKDSDIIDISATIYCERNSHKGIIIGKNGRKLKGIGKSARQDIERLLGTKVFLETWVKVKEDWRNNQSNLRNFGYE